MLVNSCNVPVCGRDFDATLDEVEDAIRDEIYKSQQPEVELMPNFDPETLTYTLS